MADEPCPKCGAAHKEHPSYDKFHRFECDTTASGKGLPSLGETGYFNQSRVCKRNARIAELEKRLATVDKDLRGALWYMHRQYHSLAQREINKLMHKLEGGA